MKISLVALLLLSSVPVLAHDYQRGYITQRTCYKEIYKEEYIVGTRESRGYVQSFSERVKVPCNQLAQIHDHHHIPPYNYSRTSYYQPRKNYRISRINSSASICNSSRMTGGLLGGGIAVALSKKDAYGWSIPLGSVVGMSMGSSDC